MDYCGKYVEELLKVDEVKELCDENRIKESDIRYIINNVEDLDQDITTTGLDYLTYELNCLGMLKCLYKWFYENWSNIKLKDGTKSNRPTLRDTVNGSTFLGQWIQLSFTWDSWYEIRLEPYPFKDYKDKDFKLFDVPVLVIITLCKPASDWYDSKYITLKDISPKYILERVNKLYNDWC